MKITKRCACATCTVIMLFALAFVAHGQTTRTDRINIGGATTVTHYIQSLIPEFEAKNPSIAVTLVASSTGRGLRDLFS